MAEIALTGKRGSGKVAIVDDDLFEALAARSWCVSSNGYPITFDRERGRGTITMHRVVLGLRHGDPDGGDHRNRDKLDNRRSNLRQGSNALNLQNTGSAGRRGGSSRFRGVWWNRGRGRWDARVKVNGVTHWVGRFTNEIDAGRAAQALRIKLMPWSIEEPI